MLSNNLDNGTPGAILNAGVGLTTPLPPGSFTLTIPEANVPSTLGATNNGHVRFDESKFEDIVLVETNKLP